MKTQSRYESLRIILGLLRKDKQMLASICGNARRILSGRFAARVKSQQVFFISLTEHIGDIVAAEPLVGVVRQKFPSAYIVWIVNKKFESLVATHPEVNKTLHVTSFTEWILLQRFVPQANLFDLHMHGKICDKYGFYYQKKTNKSIDNSNYYNFGNLLNAFSSNAGLLIDTTKAPRLYLAGERVMRARPYIVLHTSSNNKMRNATPAFWQQLTEFVLASFLEIEVIEIGLKQVVYTSSQRYINETGFRSFETIAELIRGCALFLGVDSGFAHFANALEKEALIFIGKYYTFENYMPYSGKFQHEKEKQIYYFDGEISNLEFEAVQQKLENKLTALVKEPGSLAAVNLTN